TSRRRRVITYSCLASLEQPAHVNSRQTHGYDPQARPVTRSSAAIQSGGSSTGGQDHLQDHVASGRPSRPPSWTKSPLNSPSDTSRSAKSFSNGLNKPASCC